MTKDQHKAFRLVYKIITRDQHNGVKYPDQQIQAVEKAVEDKIDSPLLRKFANEIFHKELPFANDKQTEILNLCIEIIK